MVTSFNSLPELMSNCDNSTLKSEVFRALRNKTIIWNFISGSVCSDDTVLASFDSQIEGTSRKHHLTAKVTPNGKYLSYSVI